MKKSYGIPITLRQVAILVGSLTVALNNGLAQAVPTASAEPVTSPEEVQAAEKRADKAAAVTPIAAEEEPEDDTVVLSPFVVDASKDIGYYAENTLAGSRLNTNLGDIAASITVVTKQQMDDTASLDINDVFRFESNTEGSLTYTPAMTDRGTMKDPVSGYSAGGDGSTTTNAESNRVRGMSAPDASIDYFPSNSRIPFDSYNTQSVEISRGPNALLFGLGSPAGIVNQSPTSAVLDRNSGQVGVRVDHNGSFRSWLSANRTIIPGRLAVFGAVLYDDAQFERKPSYERTDRYFGAITFKPFERTTVRGFAEVFDRKSNRPNFVTPRDFVTPWFEAGRPAYNPVTRSITIQDTNVTYGPYVFNTRSPGRPIGQTTLTGNALLTDPNSPFYTVGIAFDDTSRPLQRIDRGEAVDFFQRNPVFYRPGLTNPATAQPSGPSLGWGNNDPRYAITDRQWTTSTALPIPTTTIDGVQYTYASWQNPGVHDKSIYDWTEYNTNQSNWGELHAENYKLEIEHQILDNLHFSAGWFRQFITSESNYTISQTTGATVAIDTNLRLPTGEENPYFGLPYIQDSAPDTFYNPETDDNYRAMLTYTLDFTKKEGLVKWLGTHRLLGLWSLQRVDKEIERWRSNFVTGDTLGMYRYVPNTLIPGTSYWNSSNKRWYYLASPGDPQARVSQSLGFWGNKGWDRPYQTSINVIDVNTLSAANAANPPVSSVQVTQEATFSNAGSYASFREVESMNAAIQSWWWNQRLVTTFGLRRDDYRARRTNLTTPPTSELYENGVGGIVNRDLVMNSWGAWDELSGDTTTIGAAFRPFSKWDSIERGAAEGRLWDEFLTGLTFYYNVSDNFNPPPAPAVDYFGKPLPKPSGEGKDYGIGFSLFRNKLNGRFTFFETENRDERNSSASNLLGRLSYSDTKTGLGWAETVVRLRHGADPSVSNWNSDAVNPVTSDALQQEVWDLLQLPRDYYDNLGGVRATQQSRAKGWEMSLNYNPMPNWTVKVTAAKQETTYTEVAPEYDEWLAERMPVWESMSAPEFADFTDGAGRRYSVREFWTGYGFAEEARIENTNGWTSPEAYHENVVESQYALAKAQEGAVSPNQRKYRASLITNYSFQGGKLRGITVGGSERWESRASVGYLGKVGDPTLPTVINLYDVTQPVYFDNGNSYTDLWISYSRKIAHDKVRMKIQLNVNNVFEGGQLVPTAVNFDGSPWAFRIIDPRQFVLTTTFQF